MIQVSVGICVKNSEKIVKEAIKSITNQDFPHERMEIIVVDDGSKDKTLSVITDCVSKIDIKAKVYSTGGRGLSVARQMVVNNACGKYIIWVDDDIRLSKDFVKKEVEFMEQNPRIGAAGGIPIVQARQPKPDHKRAHFLVTLENIKTLVYIINEKKVPSYMGTGGSIFRVEAIRQAGGFDQRIRGAGEDVDATTRITMTGWLLARTNAKFYHKIKSTWKGLFVRSLWHGYGIHYISHKNNEIYRYLWKFNALLVPQVSVWIGLKHSLKAYKLTQRKISFLLPLKYFWESLAWCIGFFKSHIDGYGHDIPKRWSSSVIVDSLFWLIFSSWREPREPPICLDCNSQL